MQTHADHDRGAPAVHRHRGAGPVPDGPAAVVPGGARVLAQLRLREALNGSPAVQRQAELGRSLSAPRVPMAGPPVQRAILDYGAAGLGMGAGAYLGSYLNSVVPYGLATVAGGALGGLIGYLAPTLTRRMIAGGPVRALEGRLAPLRVENVPDDEEALQGWADARLAGLDALEHDAYAWLNANRADEYVAPLRERVMQLLDGVQTEHGRVVDVVHRNNLSLWTPDRESLDETEAGRLDTAWDQLRNGTGLIETPGQDEGGAEIRAMHARLLSRPGGRRLLETLLDLDPLGTGDQRGRKITLESTPPDARTAEQKQEVERMRARLRQVRTELATARGTAREDVLEGERMRLIGLIDDLGGDSEAASARALDKNAANINGAATGSDARVQVQRGTRDSAATVRDARRNRVPAPAFVLYGHELIHALHFRNGEDRSSQNIDDYRNTVWTDREEYQTIAGLADGDLSENLLRDEHGITARFGHNTA